MHNGISQHESLSKMRKLSDEHDRGCKLQLKEKPSRSLETVQSKQQSRSIQQKCNYKLSPEHILFLMQQTRLKQLKVLQRQPQLKQYYDCFNNVFVILYQTSKIVLDCMFYQKTAELDLGRLQMIDVLIGEVQQDWKQQRIDKLQMCCRNIYKLCNNDKQFQRRIQFVSRKICFNKRKRQDICNCFASRDLKRFWQQLGVRTDPNDKYYFIEEMFSTPAQRLCFMDLHCFINRTLCTKAFQQKIEKYYHREEIDDDLSLDYTFQFLLIEQLTFVEESQQNQHHSEIQESKCSVM